MHAISVLGAGHIGEAICLLLSKSGRYSIHLADIDKDRCEKISQSLPNIKTYQLDLNQPAQTQNVLANTQAVISALPYHCNTQVAYFASQLGIHYLDLTEDVATTNEVGKLANKSKSCFIPQCGLAPGFISIAATKLASQFDSVDSIKMRVGALPIYPSNALKYNLSWSTEGLINQYGNMCKSIRDYKTTEIIPLEGYEKITVDGIEYEAFNTSGGLGSLCDSFEGKVRMLDYKTMRYPGHHALVSFLMNELRFNEDRPTLKKVLERSIGFSAQDKCIVFVEVRGNIANKFIQKSYSSTIYHQTLHDKHVEAIQLTTASGVCAVLDLLLSDKIGIKSGLVKSENIDMFDFLDNEFGKYYRDEVALESLKTNC